MIMFRALLVCISLISVFSYQALFATEKANETVIKVESSDEEARAQALLTKAVNYYKEKKDDAFAAFSRQGEFVDGSLYVFVIGTDGKLFASGGASSVFIGRDISKMSDVTGKPYIRETIDIATAKNAGSIEYRWLDWANRKIVRKVAYFQKVDNRIIGVGYYILRAGKEQADALLEEAVNAVKKDPKSALAAFNDMNGEFVRDDLYVFVVDLNGIMRAHGINPRLINKNAMDLKDIKDKSIIKPIVDTAKEKGKGSVVYQWQNPLTKKVETKHTSFRKVGDYIVAVGYFTR
jgi:cytochrome c